MPPSCLESPGQPQTCGGGRSCLLTPRAGPLRSATRRHIWRRREGNGAAGRAALALRTKGTGVRQRRGESILRTTHPDAMQGTRPPSGKPPQILTRVMEQRRRNQRHAIMSWEGETDNGGDLGGRAHVMVVCTRRKVSRFQGGDPRQHPQPHAGCGSVFL